MRALYADSRSRGSVNAISPGSRLRALWGDSPVGCGRSENSRENTWRPEGNYGRVMGDSIYAYDTVVGRRCYFTYRDSAGRKSTRRGFTSPTAGRRERERLMGRCTTASRVSTRVGGA